MTTDQLAQENKATIDGFTKYIITGLVGILLALTLSAFGYLNSTKLDKQVFEIYRINNIEDHKEIKASLGKLNDKVDLLLQDEHYAGIDTDIGGI